MCQDGERRYRYTLGETESPSEGVYVAVADVENCPPLEPPPLAETVDPDALDTLLLDSDGSNRISFDYCGYDVTVTPDEIRVHGPVDT